jgi:ATP-dependent Clp protease protease subunit
MKTATIRALSEEVTEVLLYDVIGADFFGEGVNAKDFRAQLKSVKTPTINLRINSPGGSVTEAAAMLAALDEHPARIEVDVDGLAASAASVVMMAGDHIRVATNGLVMIHNPHALAMGDAGEMRRMAELLDKVREQILDAYKRKSKMTKAQLSKAMDAETWYTGKEAVEAGLADEASKPVSVAAFADLLTVAAKLGAKHPPKVEQTAEMLKAIAETDRRRAIAAAL